jgi:L-fuconolactonase
MIDTHLHVWQLSAGWYTWNTPELGAVHADSAVDDIADAMAAAGVSAVVLVQAADTLAETDWLLELAGRDERVAGVVGFLPLAVRAGSSTCWLTTPASRWSAYGRSGTATTAPMS